MEWITGISSLIFGLLLGCNIAHRDRIRVVFYGALWFIFAGFTVMLLLR